MTHGNTDLGPLPYGKPDRDHGSFWVGLAMLVIFGGGLAWFTYYDLTHQTSAIRPILIAVLIVVAGFALVFLLLHGSKKARKKYEKAKRFAWQMAVLLVLCIILLALLFLLP